MRDLSMMVMRLLVELLSIVELIGLAVMHMQVLIVLSLAEIFVSLLDSKEYFTAFVTQFHPFDPIAIFIVHLFLGLLGIFNVEVIDECMWPVFRILLSLFHPDSSHTSKLRKHFLKGCLIR